MHEEQFIKPSAVQFAQPIQLQSLVTLLNEYPDMQDIHMLEVEQSWHCGGQVSQVKRDPT
jgi:hypothetical protein